MSENSLRRGCDLITNPKRFKFPRGGINMRLNLADESIHFFAQTTDYAVNLAVFPFQNQFDSAIVQVADIAMHVVPHRNILGCVAKANALNPPIEVSDATMHYRFSIAPDNL
jgi:hypothetical protein